MDKYIYYNKFIDFFKRHGLYDIALFNYFNLNSVKINMNKYGEEKWSFIGTYPNYKDKKLVKIKLVVPDIDSDIAVLINIHEYIHAIMLYKYMGREYEPDIDREVLPMFYEKLYILENDSRELRDFEFKRDYKLLYDGGIEHKLWFDNKNELLRLYNEGYDFDRLNKYIKKICKDMSKKNKKRVKKNR